MQGTQVQPLVEELRPHMLWGNEALTPQPLSPYALQLEKSLHLTMKGPACHSLRLDAAKNNKIKYICNRKTTQHS